MLTKLEKANAVINCITDSRKNRLFFQSINSKSLLESPFEEKEVFDNMSIGTLINLINSSQWDLPFENGNDLTDVQAYNDNGESRFSFWEEDKLSVILWVLLNNIRRVRVTQTHSEYYDLTAFPVNKLRGIVKDSRYVLFIPESEYEV